MNTRIQVEHPVTEMVTGVDLVREQILVAAGQPLSHTQDDIQIRGHAIECRINAENPADGFRPSPGKIEKWVSPTGVGVRVDTHVQSGYVVPPHYDSLIAKLLVWGRDRDEAMRRGKRALEMFRVEGIRTSIPLHLRILEQANLVLQKFGVSAESVTKTLQALDFAAAATRDDEEPLDLAMENDHLNRPMPAEPRPEICIVPSALR